jgi:uncharacterized protein YkwD
LSVSASGASAGDPIAERVVEHLQGARVEGGGASLERREDLDAVALDRARTIAGLPHPERLAYEEPISEALRNAGVQWFSAAAAHLDMSRGYTRPEIGFVRSWENYGSAWERALSARYSSIGAASHRAEDGWVIFVAILVEDLRVPEDLREAELALLSKVNSLREDRGLSRLVEVAELSAVARMHSEDMAGREYLDHVNPDGMGPAERVNLAGIDFDKLAENVASNRGHRDPMAHVVEQWLGSPGHRESLLDASFDRTGVGVALDDDGVFYFTQLYMRGP